MIHFRMLFVGHFKVITSQRGLAWRCGESLLLQTFLRLALTEAMPNRSSLFKIDDRLPEVHDEVFGFVLKLVHDHRLLSGEDGWYRLDVDRGPRGNDGEDAPLSATALISG